MLVIIVLSAGDKRVSLWIRLYYDNLVKNQHSCERRLVRQNRKVSETRNSAAMHDTTPGGINVNKLVNYDKGGESEIYDEQHNYTRRPEAANSPGPSTAIVSIT